MSIFGKISNILRINFVGRPLELNRLVFDDSVILENKDEAFLATRAYWKYYGYQYLGNLISFINLMIISKYKMNIKTNLIIVFLPMGFFYVYSHFTFWEIIRPVVIETRKRDKLFSTLSQEDVRIKFNTSIDNHKFIQENISVFKCIVGIFK